ncbi:hypothetical protein JHJ32_07680 [Parapedobacter sp. ISTM3]|uniref:hypothetical protein n=1 Tax=Parapedobacter sp. ISTM3 TaxID=2800130 RepID=UPI0019052723|nr:hypothetical protein [Parapedobacter sp. ISTM3]MBK1439858.1 hypothetical protein [Parapedobacter sp. ISTM3]
MVEESNVDELIAYLKSLGFEGETLEKEIVRNADIGLPRFTVDHRVLFDKGSIQFELLITTGVNGVYELERYKANYRSSVQIKHINYRGIDTSVLEDSMARINWPLFFTTGGEQHEAEGNGLNSIKDVMKQLNTLYHATDIAANKIHQQLLYKYWPKEIYELYKHPQINYMAIGHERSAEYSSGDWIPNARLAYNILSGKREELYEKISLSQLEEFAKIDLYTILNRELSKKPGAFHITGYKNSENGLTEFEVPVRWENGNYEVDIYRATYSPHPEIEHGVYNGIDSAELEAMMREIDWWDDSNVFRFPEDGDPEFRSKVYDVQEQIYRLSQDMVGAEVADKLKLKYWVGLDFFGDNIEETAWEELEGRDKIQVEFPLEFPARTLFSLMQGRPIFDRTASKIEGTAIWWRINDEHRPEQVEAVSPKEIDGQLSMLPIGATGRYEARNRLLEGNILELNPSGEKSVSVTVDPKAFGLQMHTSDGRPIAFNFSLDPDWKPSEALNLLKMELGKPKMKQKGKGKGF